MSRRGDEGVAIWTMASQYIELEPRAEDSEAASVLDDVAATWTMWLKVSRPYLRRRSRIVSRSACTVPHRFIVPADDEMGRGVGTTGSAVLVSLRGTRQGGVGGLKKERGPFRELEVSSDGLKERQAISTGLKGVGEGKGAGRSFNE